MRRIDKRTEPETFRRWKASENDDWQPTWDVLQNPEKAELRQALAGEQGWTCCYCCARIDNGDSGERFHVEHLRPRSSFEDLALHYDNLLASCGHPTRQRGPDALRCGEAKEEWFDESLFVSPLAPDCEEHFSYNARGEIGPARSGEPSMYRAAAETIHRLRLNDEVLRRQRDQAVEGLLLDLDSLTEDDLRRLFEGLAERDDRDQVVPFAPALRAVLKGLLP